MWRPAGVSAQGPSRAAAPSGVPAQMEVATRTPVAGARGAGHEEAPPVPKVQRPEPLRELLPTPLREPLANKNDSHYYATKWIWRLARWASGCDSFRLRHGHDRVRLPARFGPRHRARSPRRLPEFRCLAERAASRYCLWCLYRLRAQDLRRALQRPARHCPSGDDCAQRLGLGLRHAGLKRVGGARGAALRQGSVAPARCAEGVR